MEETSAPLVSVIVIFLNAENYIRETIESVFNQTMTSWELLLVDDGSSDGGTQIACEFASRFPGRIKYFEHEGHQNKGTSVSRNLGFRHARGKYIAQLDADDIFMPDKLEKQARIMDAHPEVGMVFAASLMWFSWSNCLEDKGKDYYRRTEISKDVVLPAPKALVAFLSQKVWSPGMGSTLIRRDAFAGVGGYEDHFTSIMEDQAFFFKIALHYPTYVMSDLVDKYRQHATSLTKTKIREGVYDPAKPSPSYAVLADWLQGYLKSQRVRNTLIWAMFYRRFWAYRFPWLYPMARPLLNLKNQFSFAKRGRHAFR